MNLQWRVPSQIIYCSLAPYLHTSEVHNTASANVLVPFIYNIVKPHSVLDVGCGLGDFLSVFEQCGVEQILGIDGKWAPIDKLYISPDHFREIDLRFSFDLSTKFDLLLCLEVAEHLPAASADTFIKSLTKHADVIIFSAAIPNQGGQNHLNEQPFEYWRRKFQEYGFLFYDVFRPKFWNEEAVAWWYRQNMFLVARPAAHVVIQNKFEPMPPSEIALYVHPGLLDAYAVHVQNLQAKINELETVRNQILEGRYTWQTYFRILIKKLRLNKDR